MFRKPLFVAALLTLLLGGSVVGIAVVKIQSRPLYCQRHPDHGKRCIALNATTTTTTVPSSTTTSTSTTVPPTTTTTVGTSGDYWVVGCDAPTQGYQPFTSSSAAAAFVSSHEGQCWETYPPDTWSGPGTLPALG